MEVYVVRDAPLPLLLPTSVPPALAGMERCCWGTWCACPVSQRRQTVATPSSARSSPSCPGSQEPLSIQTLVTLVTVVLQEVGGRLTSGSLSLCSPPPVFLSSLPSESHNLQNAVIILVFILSQLGVLEKTLESPLASKEIKPVNPKGNQP